MHAPFEIQIDDIIKYVFWFPILFCPLYAGGQFFLRKHIRKNILVLSGDERKRYWAQAYLASLIVIAPAGLIGMGLYRGAKTTPILGLEPILCGFAGSVFGFMLSLVMLHGIRTLVSARAARSA